MIWNRFRILFFFIVNFLNSHIRSLWNIGLLQSFIIFLGLRQLVFFICLVSGLSITFHLFHSCFSPSMECPHLRYRFGGFLHVCPIHLDYITQISKNNNTISLYMWIASYTCIFKIITLLTVEIGIQFCRLLLTTYSE